MLKAAPTPVDVQDLQFKLHCRLRVFENEKNTDFGRHCSLVACASRFGLIFVGTNTANIQVIQLKDIEKYRTSDGDLADYPRRNLPLPSPPSHVSVNCEHTLLAIVVERNNCPCALFYDVKSFWQQEVVQISEVRLSPTPTVQVTEVNWNPALAPVFTACKNDGTLGIYEIKTSGVDINELPAAAGATCFCWSPKGKQIAVGSRDGKITQLKPDLKAVKVINAPPLKEPHVLKSLQWVSNYQFIGVFQPASGDGQAVFIVVDSPKAGDPAYVNYDDICYSNGNSRPVQFYTILLHSWNVLMAASSNSMEVGILGNSGECWTQWCMGDAARAELPLSSHHQETLPVGCALDIGSTQLFPWGESTLPPTPLLLLYSDHGTLCVFNVVNLKGGTPTICTPPDPIKDTSGLQHFVVAGTQQKVSRENLPKELPKITTQSPFVENQKPAPSPGAVGVTNPPSIFKVPQPQVTAPSQVLNLSKPQTVNLFGGQATLTPIPQATKTALPTQYPSLFSTQPTVETKPVHAAPVIQIPTSAISVPSTVPKPAVSSDAIPATLPKLSQLEASEDLTQTEVAVDLKAEEEAERIFAQMVREECMFLESELKAVLHQGRSLKFNLGSDDDKTRIVESTNSLGDFFREVVEICVSQNAEVHILKQNILQSWAWYEEAKSRHLASEDESMMMLIRSQPLDSASEKQRADIQHSNYYLESQISQAHGGLDEQWEQFQDYCKKTHKIQIPTMEMIFQTMVRQNAVLRKQSYILKDIASRIKQKSREPVGPPLLRLVDDAKDLPDELKRLRMDPEDITQMQYQHVTNRMKNFTSRKVNSLRSFLKKRDYSQISVMKPQMSTSLIQASPASRLKLQNWSAPKTPPAIKEILPKKLEFVQSTPKPTVAKSEPTANMLSSTPIEGLQSFALKFEAKHFASNLTDKTFTPLTKSTIASSPNSAFVSTSFGSSSSASSVIPSKPTFLGMSSSTTAKASPTFVMTTTAPEANQPVVSISVGRPFSFANTEGAPKNTQRTVPFSLGGGGGGVSVSSSLDMKAATSPKPGASFSLAPSVKPAVSSTSDEAGLVFGSSATSSTTPASFSFGGGAGSSVFGAAGNQKSEPVVATTRPFAFSQKTTTVTATTPSSIFVPKIGSAVVIPTSFQAVTTSVSSAKDTSVAQSTPVTKGVTQVAAPSSVTPSITSSVQSVISSAVTTPGTSATAFSLGGMKPSIFASAAPATSTVATTASTAASVSTSSTAPAAVSTSTPTASIFAQTTKQSIFASVNTLVGGSSNFTSPGTSSKPSLFGNTDANSSKGSIFGSVAATPATTSPVTSTTATTQSSIFGAPSPTTTAGFISSTTSNPQAPLFGSNSSTITTQSSVFGSTPSTSVAFGAASSPAAQGSVFGATPSTSSAFGTVSTPTTQSSIFNTTSSGVFGAAPTTQSSVFGSAPTVSTSSLFGAPIASTAQSVFSQSSVFGGAVSPTQQSIFGQAPATTTQSQSFGMFGDQSQKSSSIFGNPPTTSSQPSAFGASTQSSVFGNATSSSSIFGQNPTPNTFGQSVFGAASGSSFAGSSSAFGSSSPTFGQSGGSVFGGVPTTSSGSIFGAAPSTGSSFASTGTIFGTPASSAQSPFGSASIFSSNTTQQSAFPAKTSTGTFGFGGLSVGSTSTTSSSGFGSAAAANPFGGESKSVFGAAPTSSTNPVFGQSSGSLFGSPSQGFSSSGGGFAGQSSPFGQQGSFGQGSFGGGSSFGQASAGPFSGGSTAGVGQTGFGTSSNFQKPAGFGGSPVFGGSPAFGSAPSFGGAPSFGSSPTFGGSPKVFGGASSGFGGAPSSPAAGFGNLATQPTVGFGNLAQQATNPAASNAPFSAGTSSFSSWR